MCIMTYFDQLCLYMLLFLRSVNFLNYKKIILCYSYLKIIACINMGRNSAEKIVL